jgi:hypothetical protein
MDYDQTFETVFSTWNLCWGRGWTIKIENSIFIEIEKIEENSKNRMLEKELLLEKWRDFKFDPRLGLKNWKYPNKITHYEIWNIKTIFYPKLVCYHQQIAFYIRGIMAGGRLIFGVLHSRKKIISKTLDEWIEKGEEDGFDSSSPKYWTEHIFIFISSGSYGSCYDVASVRDTCMRKETIAYIGIKTQNPYMFPIHYYNIIQDKAWIKNFVLIKYPSVPHGFPIPREICFYFIEVSSKSKIPIELIFLIFYFYTEIMIK